MRFREARGFLYVGLLRVRVSDAFPVLLSFEADNLVALFVDNNTRQELQLEGIHERRLVFDRRPFWGVSDRSVMIVRSHAMQPGSNERNTTLYSALLAKFAVYMCDLFPRQTEKIDDTDKEIIEGECTPLCDGDFEAMPRHCDRPRQDAILLFFKFIS